MIDTLTDYCASQPGMLMVPIEVLSDAGLDSQAATAYQARGLLTESECRRIDQMIVKYCKRANQVGRASPQWVPARIQHLCLVTNGVKTRPYFQPFHASSWLLYLDDIKDSTSSLELSIFLLFQAERQYLQQQIGASLMSNLDYFLIMNQAQIDDFCAGCMRSTRPDAAAYRALADAMPMVCSLHHERFKRPQQALPDHQHLANGLMVNAQQQQSLDALHQQWMTSAESVIASHRSSTSRPNAQSGQALMAWLESESPHLVLVGEDKELLWQGAGTVGDGLKELLARLSPEAEESIIQDLQVIDQKSRLFLKSLLKPDDLVPPAAWMTEGGLSYIHGDANRIAYSLTDDPDRLWQVAPPYERLMLAARTVHEWGHQAAESGWVRVDPERMQERKDHEQTLVELLDRIVSELPKMMKPALIAALNPAHRSSETPGQQLLKGLLRRIDDYMANFLARHYLTRDEMDTYVRNNVSSRVLDYAPEQALKHLLRIAYEYQYLHLSSVRDLQAWFMKSTWFDSLFVRPRIISVDMFMRLTDQVARICDCYEIDADQVQTAGLEH